MTYDILLVILNYILYYFKKRVLVPAVKELNDTEYFKIDFKENKVGRRVESIDFIVKDLDKRVYFNESIVKLDRNEYKVEDTSKVNKSQDRFYVPNKKQFTAKTLSDFINDFKNIDFNEKLYKKALQESIIATLDKDDSEKIYVKSYKYFKKVLENKINNLDKREIKRTKFHNFDETFTRYSEDEFEDIILKSQKKKFG